MKTSSNFSNNLLTILCILTIIALLAVPSSAICAMTLTDIFPENRIEFRNPFEPPPNPSKTSEIAFPELYIEPTVNHGLNLVLPSVLRKGLSFDAGYDRIDRLPTVKADLFLPIKAWTDKSVFLAPRVSLDAKTEGLSFGAGFRHLLTSDAMIGFHAFHDWTKRRGSHEEFLKEAGVGFELSALPGNYSDLTFSINAYFPVNERIIFDEAGARSIKEKLAVGVDAKVAFLLPAVVDWLDIRMDASFHSYRGERVEVEGHKATLSANTRDGMLRASISHTNDTFRNQDFGVEASINLAFDWNELLNGRQPFSAPYEASSMRFERRVGDGLHDRIDRRHNLPLDRAEKQLALATRISDRTVFFDGAFPDLPNSRLTVQISQSPWRDASGVVTDSSGTYSGKLDLPPGEYKIRLLHKPTGKMSAVKTLVIREDGSSATN